MYVCIYVVRVFSAVSFMDHISGKHVCVAAMHSLVRPSIIPVSVVYADFHPGIAPANLLEKVKQGDDLHSHAQFFEAYSAKLNVSVVAIRGTDVGRISDLIEDIKVGSMVWRPSIDLIFKSFATYSGDR